MQSDDDNFARWNRYARSGDPGQGRARRQRTAAAASSACGSSPTGWCPRPAAGQDAGSTRRPAIVAQRRAACAISSPRISATTSTASTSPARPTSIPKYAMSLFKKSTGMTLNEYVNLLRLSYAQALLMHEDANVLQRRDGQRLRLAQRLQQILPQDRRHVAVRFSQGSAKRQVEVMAGCRLPVEVSALRHLDRRLREDPAVAVRHGGAVTEVKRPKGASQRAIAVMKAPEEAALSTASSFPAGNRHLGAGQAEFPCYNPRAFKGRPTAP